MRNLKDILNSCVAQRTAEGTLTRKNVVRRTFENAAQRTFENVFDIDYSGDLTAGTPLLYGGIVRETKGDVCYIRPKDWDSSSTFFKKSKGVVVYERAYHKTLKEFAKKWCIDKFVIECPLIITIWGDKFDCEGINIEAPEVSFSMGDSNSSKKFLTNLGLNTEELVLEFPKGSSVVIDHCTIDCDNLIIGKNTLDYKYNSIPRFENCRLNVNKMMVRIPKDDFIEQYIHERDFSAPLNDLGFIFNTSAKVKTLEMGISRKYLIMKGLEDGREPKSAVVK